MQNRQEEIKVELKELMKSEDSSPMDIGDLEIELIESIDLEQIPKVEILEKISELTQ